MQPRFRRCTPPRLTTERHLAIRHQIGRPPIHGRTPVPRRRRSFRLADILAQPPAPPPEGILHKPTACDITITHPFNDSCILVAASRIAGAAELASIQRKYAFKHSYKKRDFPPRTGDPAPRRSTPWTPLRVSQLSSYRTPPSHAVSRCRPSISNLQLVSTRYL